MSLKEKDESYRIGYNHKELKFVNIDKYADYTTLCLKDNLKPIKSE